MKKIIKNIPVLLFLVCCSIFGIQKDALAAVGRAISISPTSERIILTPGETYYSGFQIVNPADAMSDLNYVATVGTYSTAGGPDGKDDYGAADLETVTEMNDIMKWTTIDNPTGTVVPNTTKTLSYTIDVPKDAPAGGQYMTILVKENPEAVKPEDGSSSIRETMQMGFVVYAEVAGNTRQEGVILENSIPGFLMSSPLETTSIVRNNGNIHTDASYVLQVWPLFSDEEICTNEEEPDESFILPNTQRFHMQACKLPSVGIFRAKQTVKIFGETSIVEKIIIICPIWLMFIIFFVIAAIVIWLVMRVRARGKQKSGRKETTNY